jgi:Cu(I)/Ag(I) efflux system membrane protein CusA/SilA
MQRRRCHVARLAIRIVCDIRTENAVLALYIFIDIRGGDHGGYVAEAKQAVEREVRFPPGNFPQWSGQFEYLERARSG